MKIISHPTLCQIIKFGIIGLTAFAIDNSIFRVLQLLDANSHLAIAVGFAVTLLFNYFFSIKWVFNSKRKEGAGVLAVFSVLGFIGFLLTEILFTLILFILADDLHSASHGAELAAKFIATFIVMVYNFITRKVFLER